MASMDGNYGKYKSGITTNQTVKAVQKHPNFTIVSGLSDAQLKAGGMQKQSYPTPIGLRGMKR